MSHKYYKNMVRVLRLQMKTGYRSEIPAEYEFMKMYPPLHRDTAVQKRVVKPHRIPYLYLYRGAVAKNPLYADDRVFPAYWQYEPSALTVARRQYQHMKEGMDEKTAYEKAVKYVDDKENDCYVDLLELKKKLEDSEAVKSFVSDPSSLRFISYWREKLAKTKYSELELADQGEIDHFVQTKVLKWNEVERERRMKDPMFFMNFEDVRSEIFPDISKTVRMMEPGIPDDMQGFKRGVSDMYNEKNVSLWRTSAPFYYEDYAKYFEKAKAQPVLENWTEEERDEFSRWVSETLAFSVILETSPRYEMDGYLASLKSDFFPMLKVKENDQGESTEEEYNLPDELGFRTVLYENDIGYKREGEENKLFVKRFYRLPELLFPLKKEEGISFSDYIQMAEEAMAELRNEGDQEEESDDFISSSHIEHQPGRKYESLVDTVLNTDEDSSAVDKLHADLRALSRHEPSDHSSLLPDALIQGRGENEEPQMGNGVEKFTSASGYDGDLDFESNTETDLLVTSQEDRPGEGQVIDKFRHPAAFQEFLDEHYKPPRTRLETERDLWFSQAEPHAIDEAVDESDVLSITGSRMDQQLMTRAELAIKYDEKEAARLTREWAGRVIPWGKQSAKKGSAETLDMKLSLSTSASEQ